VPCEVIWWALRFNLLFKDATSVVKVNVRDSKAFGVRVDVHRESGLSPLLFIILLEALSREFREGLPMELLYTDLVLMAEMEEQLVEKIQKWKKSMERGLLSKLGKTKVMKCDT